MPSSVIQTLLRERFEPPREYQPDQPRSGGTRGKPPLAEAGTGKKTAVKEVPSPPAEWQEGAGSLLLLAAAHQTGLLTELQTVLSPSLLTADPALRLTRSQPATLCRQVLTLLLSSSRGTAANLGRDKATQAKPWLYSRVAGSPTAIATPSGFWLSWRRRGRMRHSPKPWQTGRLLVFKPQSRLADGPVAVFYIDGRSLAVYADQPLSTRVGRATGQDSGLSRSGGFARSRRPSLVGDDASRGSAFDDWAASYHHARRPGSWFTPS
jgi:hypothetical protein